MLRHTSARWLPILALTFGTACAGPPRHAAVTAVAQEARHEASPVAAGVAAPPAGQVRAESAPFVLPSDLARAMPMLDGYAEALDLAVLAGSGGWTAMFAPTLASLPALQRVPEETLAAALQDLTQVAFGLEVTRFSAGAILRFSDRAAAEALLAALELPAREGAPPGTQRYADAELAPHFVSDLLWVPAERTLVVGDGPFVGRVLAVAAGTEPSLGDDPKFVARRARAANPHGLTITADLARLGREATPQGFSFREPWQLTLSPPPSNALALELPVEGGLAGAAWATPTKLDLAARLPAESVGYLAFASRGQGAPTERYRRLVDGVATMFPEARRIDERLRELQLQGADVLAEVATQGVVAVVVDPQPAPTAPFERRLGVVLLQEVVSPRSANKFTTVLDRLSKKLVDHIVKRDATSLRALAKSPNRPSLLVAFSGSTAFVGVGNDRALDRAFDVMQTGKASLGSDGPAREPRLATLVLRPERLMASIPDADRAVLGDAFTSGLGSLPPIVAHYTAEGDGGAHTRVRLEVSGASTIGTFSAIAANGVRRYLASAKSREAKNTVASIARAAFAAYEREVAEVGQPSHRLCESAEPLPRDVPRGKVHDVDPMNALGLESGDARRGWRCLKFALSLPTRFRYTYRVGGGYLGPARGGPDPGPNGFEAAAEGDLDGDGKTSLFTIVGRFDPKTDSFVASKLFVVDEFE